MKCPITALILLLLTICAYSQQITLNGQVSIHNSQYRTGSIQYVTDAYVSAPFTTPDATDEEGRFGLEFVGIDAGSSVKVNVERANLEVVNAYDLLKVILGRKPLLRVFLAEKGRLEQAQTELYKISREALFARKNALIAQLQASESESRSVISMLEERFGQKIANRFEAEEILNSKIESLEKRLPEFAQELASVNLDFASEMYRESYEHYKNGDIEQAIAVLDDAKLDESYQDALSTIREGEKLETIGKELQEKGLLQIEQIVDSYKLKAESFRLLIQYRSAAEVYEKIIRMLKESKPEEDIELADVYENTSILYFFLGAYTKAYLYSQRNVSVKENLFDAGDERLTVAYNVQGLVLQAQGNYSEAEPFYRRALKISESQLGPEHPEVAASLNNLAALLQAQGHYSEAKPFYQRALKIRESQLGPEHPSVAASLNNLAGLLQAQGNYIEAEPLYRRALKIIEVQLGLEHPEVATSLNNLALLLELQRRYIEAEPLYQRALRIVETQLGRENPKVATTLNNLALLREAQGRYIEAEPLYQRALKIYKSQLGPEHPNVASALNNLAFLLEAQGRYIEAEPLYKRALNIKESQLGREHPSVATSLNNLSGLLLAQSNYIEAEPLLQRSLKIFELQLGPEHPDTKVVRYKIEELKRLKSDNEYKMRLSIIVTKTETMAEQVLQKLKNGISFAQLAREFSIGPGKEQGGDIGFIAPEDMSGDLKKAVTELEVGQYSDIIKTEHGYCIIAKTIGVSISN
ncbi:MAG: tetratricopeptide repeat protein [Calditrichia bacterium]